MSSAVPLYIGIVNIYWIDEFHGLEQSLAFIVGFRELDSGHEEKGGAVDNSSSSPPISRFLGTVAGIVG